MVCPATALAIALCKLVQLPAVTVTVDPGDGVLAVAVLMQLLGAVAGPPGAPDGQSVAGPVQVPLEAQYRLSPAADNVHVRLALALIAPTVARIVLVPADEQLKFCVVEVVPNVATTLLPLDQVADVVRFSVEPSL